MTRISSWTSRILAPLFLGCLMLPMLGCTLDDSALMGPADPAAQFSTTTEREGDRIEIVSTGGKQAFTVSSQTGIGRGVITLDSGKWVAPATISFRLQGMESLFLEYAADGDSQVKQKVSITSQLPLDTASEKARQSLLVDGTETPITTDSPYAVIVSNTTVENQSLIHVTLSSHFVASQPKSLSIHWIDFYR